MKNINKKTPLALGEELKILQKFGQKSISNAMVFQKCGLKEKKPPKWQSQNVKTDLCLETLEMLANTSTCECNKLGYVPMPTEFFGDE